MVWFWHLCCDQEISNFASTGSHIFSFKAGIFCGVKYSNCYKLGQSLGQETSLMNWL